MKNKFIKVPKNLPEIIIIVGPCRVGTTALAVSFTKIGIPVHMQPIKSIRRAIKDCQRPKEFTFKGGNLILIKETIGAKTKAEFFDPVKILIDLGYLKKKIKVVPIVRDPRKTLASWEDMWGKIKFKKFVKSFSLTKKIKDSKSIKVVPFVHEATRNNSSRKVLAKLFKALDLKEKSLKNALRMKKRKEFNKQDGANNLYFYDNPPKKFTKEVRTWGKYKFKEEPYLNLSQNYRELIKKNQKLLDIYEEFRKECSNALNLNISSYSEFNY